jgi:SAM-dependent methyltransferase
MSSRDAVGESPDDRLAQIERRVGTLEKFSIEAFWTALDRAYEATLPQRKLACIVCGQTDLRSGFTVLIDHCIFGGGILERYQCPACDAVFGPQKCLDLSEDFVSFDYSMLYSRYKEIDLSNNVIEHFRNPVAQFEEFHRILRPGGVMAHSSPCYEYAYACTRFHTLFLTGRSAEVLAGRTGFRVSDRRKNGEYINLVYSKLPIDGSSGVTAS